MLEGAEILSHNFLIITCSYSLAVQLQQLQICSVSAVSVMKLQSQYSCRLLITVLVYCILIICLASTIFATILVNLGEEESTSSDPPINTSTEISTTSAIVSTSMSLNGLLCAGYLCDYGSFQVSGQLHSFEECEESCLIVEECYFVTFTRFRNQPLCYLLMNCDHINGPCEYVPVWSKTLLKFWCTLF